MPEWMVQIGVMVFGSGAVYGAIRADIRAIHERVNDAKEAADEAHRRIDGLLIRGKQHG